MENINFDKHPTFLAVPQVREICKPLFEQFGLNYFQQTKIYKDGTACMLTTSGEFTEMLLKTRILAAEDIIQTLQPGSYFWNETYKPLPIKAIESMREQITIASAEFNINNCFMIIENSHSDYINIYDIGAPKSNQSIRNFYINNQPLLLRFINYFQDKATNIRKTIEENRTQIYNPIQTFALEKSVENQTVNSKFLNSTKPSNLYLSEKNLKLTKRELECLLYTLHGLTSKETAKIINVSPKTVQSYIEEVKNKLGCSKRSELFQIAIDLKLIKVAELL